MSDPMTHSDLPPEESGELDMWMQKMMSRIPRTVDAAQLARMQHEMTAARRRVRLVGGITAGLLLAVGVTVTMVLLLKTTGHVVAHATGPTPPPTNPGPPERAFDPSAVQLDLTSKYGAVLARRRMLLSNDTLDCTVSSFPAGRFRHGCVLKIGPENDKVDPWKLTLDAAEGRFKQANFVVQTGSVPGDLLMVVVLSSTREPHLADLPLYQSVVDEFLIAHRNDDKAEIERLQQLVFRAFGLDPADAILIPHSYEQRSLTRNGR